MADDVADDVAECDRCGTIVDVEDYGVDGMLCDLCLDFDEHAGG